MLEMKSGPIEVLNLLINDGSVKLSDPSYHSLKMPNNGNFTLADHGKSVLILTPKEVGLTRKHTSCI